MKPKIAIVDYGMGNLRSVEKAIQRVGYDAEITQDPQKIRDATHVVVPGQGAFCDAKRCLEENKLTGEVVKAIESGKPFLGICLGLQLLMTTSYENGTYEGLDIIPGDVIRFQGNIKIPHIGWNQLILKKSGVILEGIANDNYAYFDHSYYVRPQDTSVVAITTDYGGEYTSMIWKDNIIATQFHPEKSQKVGLQILTNFGKMK